LSPPFRMHEIPTTYGLKVFIRSDDSKPAPIEMLVLDPAIRLTWAEAAPRSPRRRLAGTNAAVNKASP
jgi:hypothetical protein